MIEDLLELRMRTPPLVRRRRRVTPLVRLRGYTPGLNDAGTGNRVAHSRTGQTRPGGFSRN